MVFAANVPFTFQHTAARRRLRAPIGPDCSVCWFQHTAARRRLLFGILITLSKIMVSTHSRAEAAAITNGQIHTRNIVSTHSRAEAAAFVKSSL